MDKITIIMVTKDQSELTLNALWSLFRRTDPNKYLLRIYDNGSTQENRETVDKFIQSQNKDGAIDAQVLYSPENKGWITAINKGYETCKTELVLTCHNDVVFSPYWLENMIRKLEEDPQVAAVGPVISFAMGQQSQEYAYLTIGAEVKFLLGLFFLCRKSALEDIRYENGDYLSTVYGMGDKEELELCYRLQEKGWTLAIARDVLIDHTGERGFIDHFGSQEVFHQYQKDQEAILRQRLGDEKVNGLFQIRVPRPTHVMIGIPTRSMYVHTHFAFSLSSLFLHNRTTKISTFHIPRAMISDARNRIVDFALEDDTVTHVCMIDDDMLFPYDTLQRLLSHEVDIVSGVAFMRGEPYLPCTFYAEEATKLIQPVEVIRKGMVQVDAFGGYFSLVNIDVYKKLPRPWYVYGDNFMGFAQEAGGMGEDISFCIKAKILGNYEVWVDSDLIIQHIGLEELVDDKVYIEHKKNGGLNGSIIPKEVVFS